MSSFERDDMIQPDHRQREKPHNLSGITRYSLIGISVLALLHLTTLYNYTLFHSLAEGFSICISIGIFMFAWNSRRFKDNSYVLLLGIAFLFTGFIDGIHALSYKGIGVFHGYDANLPTQLWILSRYLESVSFLAAAVFLKRSIRAWAAFGAYAAVTVLSLLSIFFWDVFPDCYVEGSGLTAFKVGSEYVIILIFLASLGAVSALRQWFDKRVFQLLLGSIVLNIAAELSFTNYLGVYDFFNELGHFFEIAAYYLVYRAVIVTGLDKPYDLIFRNLRQSREVQDRINKELEERVRERDAAVEFMRLANESSASEDLIRMTVNFLKQQSGCQAVGIRLQAGEDFPYLDSSGFPEEFIKLESILCETDSEGKTKRDDSGRPILECLCGNVIRGNVDASKPFFTARGSFWTNSTTELIAAASEQELKTRPRNRCNAFGYESVALIPLRSGEKRLGLIQLNDPRKGVFSRGSIALWERLGDYFVSALIKSEAEESLKRMVSRFELLTNTAGELLQSPDAQKVVESLCLKVMEHLDCHAFFHFLVDERREILHLNAYAGIPEEEARKIEWLECGAAVCGCAAQEGRRIVAEHIFSTPDIRTETIKSYGIKAYAVHPLLAENGKVIGTLSFGTRTRETFSESDLSLMRAVADQVAVAMIRLKAEEEVRRHRDHLEETVKKRTHELEARNLQLETEMAERKRAEEEKKAIEAQLVQAQKMEALGRFSGGIAHDLNNILYPVLLNTQMLLADSTPGSSMHQTLEQTLTAIYRQRDLIRQILSFSRRNEQQFKPVRVKPIVKETIGLLRSLIPSTVEIKENIDGSPDTVLGDPTQIQQIVMNLCRNAADAMESLTGTIEVSIGSARLEPDKAHPDRKAGEYLELSVKDTGCGMTPEVMSRIFEPFFTTKEVGKGTGMGLAVIHGIIKSHGGTVTVESQAGKGSRFVVHLPLVDGDPGTDEQGAGSIDRVKGTGRVLLVDDEEIVLKSVSKVLKVLGYDVATAKSGSEAVEVFSGTPEGIDLVISDMTMPGMTGLELAEKLLGIRSDIPVILCTGLSDSVNSQHARDTGIRELLEKPADIDDLAGAINRALEREKSPDV